MGKRTFTGLIFMLALAGPGLAPPAAAEDSRGLGGPAADLGIAYERAIALSGGPAAAPAGKWPRHRDRDLTRAVQQALRAVGLDPGPPDGLMGPKTRAAIRGFRRQHGLAADGGITGGLVEALVAALASAPRVPPPLPANAHRIPFLDDWACDRGFRRAGKRCERLDIPAHASPGLLGDSWVCESGYRRVAGRCARVVVPLNARARPGIPGDGWECNRGYRRVGRQCERVPVPRNAVRDRSGDGWSCSRGYRQAGNMCIRESLERRALTCCGLRPPR